MDTIMERQGMAPKKRKAARLPAKCSNIPARGMDRFFTSENIASYRMLASKRTNAVERSRILNLLAEEEAKFKSELRRPPRSGPAAYDF